MSEWTEAGSSFTYLFEKLVWWWWWSGGAQIVVGEVVMMMMLLRDVNSTEEKNAKHARAKKRHEAE